MLQNDFFTSGAEAGWAVAHAGGSDKQTASEWLAVVATSLALVEAGQGASNAFGNYSVLENGVTVIGGTPESDFRDGTTGADVLMGFDGADHLAGGKGQDILYGGTGPDTFFGGSSDTIDGWNDGVSDLLVGGAGFDTYDVSEYADAFGEETDPSIKRDRAFYLKALDKLDVIVDSNGRGEIQARYTEADKDHRADDAAYHQVYFKTKDDPFPNAGYEKPQKIDGLQHWSVAEGGVGATLVAKQDLDGTYATYVIFDEGYQWYTPVVAVKDFRRRWN